MKGNVSVRGRPRAHVTGSQPTPLLSPSTASRACFRLAAEVDTRDPATVSYSGLRKEQGGRGAPHSPPPPPRVMTLLPPAPTGQSLATGHPYLQGGQEVSSGQPGTV